jgi:hypothetical protein
MCVAISIREAAEEVVRHELRIVDVEDRVAGRETPRPT